MIPITNSDRDYIPRFGILDLLRALRDENGTSEIVQENPGCLSICQDRKRALEDLDRYIGKAATECLLVTMALRSQNEIWIDVKLLLDPRERYASFPSFQRAA